MSIGNPLKRSDIGLIDKLYWRPSPTRRGLWHCYKRFRGERVWTSLCPSQLVIRRTDGQSIDRPPSVLRCALCDSAEMKRRGWEEGGDETIDHDKIYDLYG